MLHRVLLSILYWWLLHCIKARAVMASTARMPILANQGRFQVCSRTIHIMHKIFCDTNNFADIHLSKMILRTQPYQMAVTKYHSKPCVGWTCVFFGSDCFSSLCTHHRRHAVDGSQKLHVHAVVACIHITRLAHSTRVFMHACTRCTCAYLFLRLPFCELVCCFFNSMQYANMHRWHVN